MESKLNRKELNPANSPSVQRIGSGHYLSSPRICLLDGQLYDEQLTGDSTIGENHCVWEPIMAIGKLSMADPSKDRLEFLRTEAVQAEILLSDKAAIGRELLDLFTCLQCIMLLNNNVGIVNVDYACLLGIPIGYLPEYSENGLCKAERRILMAAENIRSWMEGRQFHTIAC